MPERVLNVRAGLIVGPHDYTDRFTYWVQRMASGDEVLAPAPASQRVQLVDSRDLAQWIVYSAEVRLAGVFNATGPDFVLTFERMLRECQMADGRETRITWADEKFLLNEGVAPWTELPLWLPDVPDDDEDAGANKYFFDVNCQKAINAGLTFRPVAESARDTLAWHRERPSDVPLRAGLTQEREIELLIKTRQF